MNVGIVGAPPGVKEARVLLTPRHVRVLVEGGASVRVASGTGREAGFDDEGWRACGADVVYSRAEAIGRSDVVLSAAALARDEVGLLARGSALVAFLDPIVDRDLVAAVNGRGAKAIDLDRAGLGGRQPVRERMAEVAGAVCVPLAAMLLQSGPSRGVLLGNVTGIAPAAVVVLGAGGLGRTAARGFAGLGASVIVLDKDLDRLRALEAERVPSVGTVYAGRAEITKAAGWADVLIGAVRDPAGAPPKLLRTSQGKRGAVWLDLAVTEGGCVEGTRPIYDPDDAWVQDGILCCPIPNLPSRAARTSSRIVAAMLAPILERGVDDPWFAAGVCR